MFQYLCDLDLRLVCSRVRLADGHYNSPEVIKRYMNMYRDKTLHICQGIWRGVAGQIFTSIMQ